MQCSQMHCACVHGHMTNEPLSIPKDDLTMAKGKKNKKAVKILPIKIQGTGALLRAAAQQARRSTLQTSTRA